MIMCPEREHEFDSSEINYSEVHLVIDTRTKEILGVYADGNQAMEKAKHDLYYNVTTELVL